MRRKILILAMAIMTNIFAQTPQSFKYQAVVRDGAGTVIANQIVGFQLSILQSSETGTAVYTETFTKTTNSYGLVNLNIGEGTPVSGDFTIIDWGADAYFLKVELDETGGTSYAFIGTSKLNSVPYALHSKTAENVFSGDYDSLLNTPILTGDVTGDIEANTVEKIQGMNVSVNSPSSGQVLKWNGTEWAPADDNVTGGSGVDGVVDGASFSGTTNKTLTLTRSNGLTALIANFTDEVNDADASTTNELITGATLNGTDLEITDAGGTSTVDLSSLDNSGTDSQTLEEVLVEGNSAGTNGIDMNNQDLTGAHILALGNSNSNYINMYYGHIRDYNGSHGVDGQVLKVYGTSPNTYVRWMTPGDEDEHNELQVLNFSNDTLYLSDGGQVYMGAYGNLWEAHGNDIYNKNTKNVGVGLENPEGKLVVQGDSAVSDTLPLFEVKNKDGQTVFAVYDGGVRMYVNDDPAKANNDKSGFAIGGLDKSITNEYLRVTPDSVRIYIKEENTNKANNKKGGFAIGGYRLDKTTPDEYLNVYAADTAYVIDTTAQMLWYPLKEAFLSGKILVEHADSVGQNSWATGFVSKSIGNYSQALGNQARAFGNSSTAIGYHSNSIGANSYSFGNYATAQDSGSYAIGSGAKATGLRSFAFGSTGIDSAGVATASTMATGEYSYAFGMGSVADTTGAFAFGTQNIASGKYSLAMGYNSITEGEGSLAIGWRAIANGFNQCTALGYQARSTGGNSSAIGNNAHASGGGSLALGNTTASGSNSTSVGHGAIASGLSSTAIGWNTEANAWGATAIGFVTTASGWYSTAMGHFSEASGKSSIAMGDYTKSMGKYSTTTGNYTIAKGDNSVAFGYQSFANSYMETVIGQYNDTTNSLNQSSWVETEPLFSIGNGSDNANRHNAVTVLKNGNVGIADMFMREMGCQMFAQRVNMTRHIMNFGLKIIEG